MKRVAPYYFLFLVPLLFGFVFLKKESIPVLNQQIVAYVKSVIGKKVDRGECWDLANEALTKAHAKWDGDFKFGKPVNPAKDTIYPGDLIQFENVVLNYAKGEMQYKELMSHHTAIVYKVNAKGEYEIAHQNTGQYGRKVGLSELKLSDMTKGKTVFYRPVSN